MTIGDTILYRGKPFAFHGFAPFGVRSESVELEDLQTGEWISVPLHDLILPDQPVEHGGVTSQNVV